MANLCSNDILPIIHTYLIEIGMQSVAKKLEKFVDFDLHTFVYILFNIILFIIKKYF